MALSWLSRASVLLCLTWASYAQSDSQSESNTNFTIVGGQIYTPGLAILDAPQPFTPLGGDFLQVALDISGNGRLPQPPYDSDVDTGILNITMFLFSYTTFLNLTISNGTTFGWRNGSFEDEEFKCNAKTTQGFQNAGCEEIMAQEPGSTVKHVNWAWPDCLVGIKDDDRDRGLYNISIHQQFRINDTDFYTIFNLPIQITNSVPQITQLSTLGTRPLCSLRLNDLQNQTVQDESVVAPDYQPYLGGTIVSSGGSSGGSSTSSGGGGDGGSSSSSPSSTPTTNPGIPVRDGGLPSAPIQFGSVLSTALLAAVLLC